MYKSRFYLWAIILIAVILINTASKIDIKSLVIENRDVTINVDTDIAVKSVLTSAHTGCLRLVQTTDNPAIIIENGSNETKDGYLKFNNAIYSPIILYIPTDYNTPSELYYTLGENAKFVSFKKVAEAIINGSTLGELGIHDGKYKNNTIVLNIPSSDTFYYDAVVEQIYVALNDNKIPTEQDRERLETTVNKLLSKSISCNDVSKKIEDNDGKTYNIFIAPEFYLGDSNYYSVTTGRGYYQTIYFEKNVALGYDVFVQTESMFGEDKLTDIVCANIIENEKFCNSSAYRTSFNHDFDNLFNAYQANALDTYFFKEK